MEKAHISSMTAHSMVVKYWQDIKESVINITNTTQYELME